jgi:putative tryptophan/tyrosine transport system substrate-binding protein
MVARRLGSRRSLIFILTAMAAVLGWSFSHAVEPAHKVVRVGFVHPQSPSTATHGPSAFWERLRELGYVEGENLIIERRWADGQMDRLPEMMADLIGRRVDVLVTFGTQTAIAAKNATNTVPIVGVAMGEPLRTGLAPSLARPGGNLTGTSVGWAEGIGGKWLELLQEAVPRLSAIAVIENPDTPIARALAKELVAIAPTRGLKVRLLEVREPAELDRAFEQAKKKAQAALLLPYPVLSAHRDQVVALAAKYRLPTIYYLRDYVEVGGLMAYAPDLTVQFRRAADYVDKILKGAKPADLPIEQPTQWSLIINLKTAKALGLTIPESILVRADEVMR